MIFKLNIVLEPVRDASVGSLQPIQAPGESCLLKFKVNEDREQTGGWETDAQARAQADGGKQISTHRAGRLDVVPECA